MENLPTTFKNTLEKMGPELEKLLPESLPLERFKRVVTSAIMNDASLLQSDQKVLFAELLACAKDGLYPDKREAAIVIYKGKPKYIAMVQGLLKRMRNTNELKSIIVESVYSNDKFRYWIDDTGPRLEFEPQIFGTDRGDKIGVFAVAYMKSGGVYIETLSKKELQKIRDISPAKNGPWASWTNEMEEKSVIRKLNKIMPNSSEINEMIDRDNEINVEEPSKPEIKSVKDLESEVSDAEMVEEKPLVHLVTKEIVKKPAIKIEPGLPVFDRKIISKEILTLSKELGWEPKKLGKYVEDNFKKKTVQLTNEEMMELADILFRLSEEEK